jgi:hypothetical protein
VLIRYWRFDRRSSSCLSSRERLRALLMGLLLLCLGVGFGLVWVIESLAVLVQLA